MSRTRRVGGFTLGVTLIVFGLLFLFKTIVRTISYSFILQFWPCILILLGCEILASYLINKEEQYKFDGFSILILMGMSFFSVMMAGAELFISHMEFFVR